MQSKNLNPIETCFGCIMHRSGISLESFNFYTFKELVREISWASKKKRTTYLPPFCQSFQCICPWYSCYELFGPQFINPLQFESPSVKVSSRDSCLTLILPNLVSVNIFLLCLYILFMFVYRCYIQKIRALSYIVW